MATKIGDRVWVPHDEDAWLSGRIEGSSVQSIDIGTDRGLLKFKPSDASKFEPCGSHINDNVENLVDLDELSEGAILHHVRKRFKKQLIYTHVGSILVAVNPFENLPIYGPADVRKAASQIQPYPHVFVTASIAYQQLKTNSQNQAVLISGESGAGKTETTKKVLSYLAQVAPGSKAPKAGEPGIEDKILQSNPLLEALGNAKTLRNNNSSRFGKWMKVDFDNTFRIQGCEIVNYLLEKSRVVFQSPMERNYHIFYQLLSTTDSQLKARLHLKSPADYHYLNQSGCIDIKGVSDAAEFMDVQEAMSTLQFPPQTCNAMFQIISAILLMGNLEFDAIEASESCVISNSSMGLLNTCGELLGVPIDVLTYALTNKNMQAGKGSIVSKKLTAGQAVDGRDTLAKSLYGNMFDWVICQVNATLKVNVAPFFIGILDIFGFEVFEINSFEQLCINYANEKLQFHFNEVIFNEETKMYTAEGVSLEKVIFEDNGGCVNLIEGKPYGLLSLLEEECSLGNATDLSYVNKIDKAFGAEGKGTQNNYFVKIRTKPLLFVVRHFAGAVEYNVTNFLDKNRDTMSGTMLEAMLISSIPLVQTLFAPKAAPPDSTDTPAAAAGKGGKGGGGGAGGKSGSKQSTLGGQFRNQLIGLVTNLKTTEPHFIRCVKPNHAKVPQSFDGQLALRQLRYAGLFEAIRIRKSGFSYRSSHDNFANTYQILVDGLLLLRHPKNGRGISSADACNRILALMTANKILLKDAWHIGNSKVFLKANMHRTLLERQKAARVTVHVIRIQAMARCYNAKKLLKKLKIAFQKRQRELAWTNTVDSRGAIIIQKYFRRYMIKSSVSIMKDLMSLRRFIAKRDIENMKLVLARIDNNINHMPDSKKDSVVAMFKHDAMVARAILRLIEIQDKFILEVKDAITTKNVISLNKLLVKSEKLEMTGHPVVKLAREELSRLSEKKKFLKMMIAFLKNESDYADEIVEIIDKAREFGVDPDFVRKVERVHESAGPRIRAKNLLRLAVETVDKQAIQRGMAEAIALQAHQPKFGETEIRAGRAMLKLIEFDEQMNKTQDDSNGGGGESLGLFGGVEDDPASPDMEHDDEDNEDGKSSNFYLNSQFRGNQSKSTSLFSSSRNMVSDGPRLSRDMIAMCDDITFSCNNPEASKHYKRVLKDYTTTKREHDRIVQAYKWAKVLCAWKYPEVIHTSSKTPRQTSAVGGGMSRGPPGSTRQLQSPGAGLLTGKSANSPFSFALSPSNTSSKFGFGNDQDNDNWSPYTGGEGDDGDAAALGGSQFGGASAMKADEDAQEFFGLRLRDARSSIYVVRLLHKDVDSLGSAPASMMAQLGALKLPVAVEQELSNFEMLELVEKERQQALNKSLSKGAQNTRVKSALPVTPTKKTTLLAPGHSAELEKQLSESRRNVSKQKAALDFTMSKLKVSEKKGSWK